MIKFNIPPFVGKEEEYIRQVVVESKKICKRAWYQDHW